MLLRKHYAAVFVLTIFLQFTRQVTKPFGVMFSSPDQTPQVPFMFFLIIHYFERPAPSVRLVKSIHLRALPQILDAAMFETCVFANCNETTSMNDFVDEPNFTGACYVSEQYCI